MGEARSYSVDDGGGWTIPIKVETSTKPRVFSPQSRSISVDQQVYKPDGSPPSKSFGVRQTEPYREIPVQVERKQTTDHLRQIPVNIEPGTSHSLKRIHIERGKDSQRQVPIERDVTVKGVHSVSHEIPIKRELKQEPVEAPNPFRREMQYSEFKSPQSYHTDVTDSYDEKVIKTEEQHKAELKRKEMELKRDIDNVILEAIQQVPIYKQTQSGTETKPRGMVPRQVSVEDEIIKPSTVESPRQQRVDQALQQRLERDQKSAIQKRWEQEKLILEEKLKQQAVGSYATLPIKKQSSVDASAMEQEPGSYSTLPSYRLKSKGPGSPKVSRTYNYDQDRNYFSDAETTRRTPTWRPVASPIAKKPLVWKPAGGTVQRENIWTPTGSPGLEKKTWSPAQAPVTSQTTADYMPTKGRSMCLADKCQPA